MSALLTFLTNKHSLVRSTWRGEPVGRAGSMLQKVAKNSGAFFSTRVFHLSRAYWKALPRTSLLFSDDPSLNSSSSRRFHPEKLDCSGTSRYAYSPSVSWIPEAAKASLQASSAWQVGLFGLGYQSCVRARCMTLQPSSFIIRAAWSSVFSGTLMPWLFWISSISSA